MENIYTRYMTALHKLSLEINRDLNRAQQQEEPGVELVLAWDHVEHIRRKIRREIDKEWSKGDAR
jgi:hypothetical protein